METNLGSLDRSTPAMTRDQGDGSATPGRPSIVEEPRRMTEKNMFKREIDLMQCFLTLVTLATRLWNLEHPRAIVFDELHYGRFAAMYVKRTFFFDVHPPLGKMLIALSGWLASFDGEFNFDRIGTVYLPNVPLWHLRCLPAVCGSLIVPVVYQIIIELGLSSWAATLAAGFILFDNSLLVQSRFMLMEPFLLLFMSLGLLSLIKFNKLDKTRSFSTSWWIWLTSIGIFVTCALCVKYIALMTGILIYSVIAKNFWNKLSDTDIPDRTMIKECLARVFCLITIPACLYLSIFYVHLSILNKAGPHDDVMTSAFQASLEGGLSSITKGQPLEIAYGSQVTLRHTHGKTCWLHSHRQLYPIRYPNGRGSSHQQQVTCYTFKDVNNWWIIKDPKRNSLQVDDPIKPVQHGDVVQIIHGITSRALNSHDVAAPVSPQFQEVTCYIDYNISVPAENLWKVEILNKDIEGPVWKTIVSQVRLVHLNTSHVLKTSGKQLPEWGFFQFEVVTDKVKQQEAAVWNVEEHRYTRTADEEETEKGLAEAEMIPMYPTQLSFISKFIELQIKMLMPKFDSQIDHKYSSSALEWPLLERNVAYWVNLNTNAQIHLLGNPVIWLSGCAGVAVYIGLLIFYILRRRRQCYDLKHSLWEQFVNVGELCLAGYILHFLPYISTERTLFLHHYLPALLFKYILLAVVIEHLHDILWNRTIQKTYIAVANACFVPAVTIAFITFMPISYGSRALTIEDLLSLKWRDSWDFLYNLQSPFAINNK